MKPWRALVLLSLVPLAFACRSAGDDPPRPADDREPAAANSLTPAERRAGWRLLFDGETTAGWRGFRRETMPAGWTVVDGSLARTGAGGDVVTVDQYGDFVLELEWKIVPGGNSGIFFHVTEDHDHVWETGPEMQVLDDERHPDGASPLTSAGANYALHAPASDATRPAGEWNHARLEVRGGSVKHVVNGVTIVEYELWSDDWRARVAASKFAAMPDYGMRERGHVALQDHGDPVWYRNVKILPLD